MSKTPEQDVVQARTITAEILGYKDWDEATDYRTTGAQDRERDRVFALVSKVLAHSKPTSEGEQSIGQEVDRAARAIFETRRDQAPCIAYPYVSGEWENMHDSVRERYRNEARAALDAIEQGLHHRAQAAP